MKPLPQYILGQINEDMVKKNEPFDCVIVSGKSKEDGYKSINISIDIKQILKFKDRFKEIKHPRLAMDLKNTVNFYSRDIGWIDIRCSERTEGGVYFVEKDSFESSFKRTLEVYKKYYKNIKTLYFNNVTWEEIYKYIIHEQI